MSIFSTFALPLLGAQERGRGEGASGLQDFALLPAYTSGYETPR